MLSWIEHEKSFKTLRPDINLFLDQDEVAKPCMLKFIYGDLTPARLNDLKEACRKEVNGPLHEKTCVWGFANNKGADQPAHPRSLISTFVIHLLESIISRLATNKFHFSS